MELRITEHTLHAYGQLVGLKRAEGFPLTAEEKRSRFNETAILKEQAELRKEKELKNRQKNKEVTALRRNIARNLKRLRKEKNYTQRVVAVMLKIPTSAVGKYEAAKVTPSEPRLQQLAEIFNVDVSEFTKEVKK